MAWNDISDMPWLGHIEPAGAPYARGAQAGAAIAHTWLQMRAQKQQQEQFSGEMELRMRAQVMHEKASAAGLETQKMQQESMQRMVDDIVPVNEAINEQNNISDLDTLLNWKPSQSFSSPKSYEFLNQHQTARARLLASTELEKTKVIQQTNEIKFQASRDSDAEKLRADGFGNPFAYKDDGTPKINALGFRVIDDAKFDEAAKAKAATVATKRNGVGPAVVASLDHANLLRKSGNDILSTNPEQAQRLFNQADLLEKWAQHETEFAPKQLVDTDTKKSIRYDENGKAIVESTTKTQRPAGVTLVPSPKIYDAGTTVRNISSGKTTKIKTAGVLPAGYEAVP